MKPAPFAYLRPGDIAGVRAGLGEAKGEAAILAGGQSLVAAMARRQRTPSVLIDINAVEGLDAIEVTAGGAIRIGATARLEQVRTHPDVAALLPLVPAALAFVASPVIRRRGTLVGNLANNAPGCEMAAVALALEAMFEFHRADGTSKAIPAADFLSGPPPRGFVSHVHFPVRGGSRAAFVEVARRPSHVCVLGAAVDLTVDRAALALAGFGRWAFRCPRSEAVISEAVRAGSAPDTDRLAAPLAADCEGPSAGDAWSSYRSDVVAVVVADAVAEALGRAG